ncbi:MAG: hypothetical protein KDA85_15850, partial [Planctomycetaceae bacterium]|nr:hypothetical protein [Planctomycetaceae bacterium]
MRIRRFHLMALALVMLAGLSVGCSSSRDETDMSMADALDAARDGGRPQQAAAAPAALPASLASNEEAPPQQGAFRVLFECSCGDFTVDVDRSWAPIGAQRFYELV